MPWSPISGTVPQYSKPDNTLASGWYLKFYDEATTTPFSMAIDDTGVTTLAKAQLNTAGEPINGSGYAFVPHVDRDYKIALYKTAADADNNTTANAQWVVDAIPRFATKNELDSSIANKQVQTKTALKAVDSTDLVEGDAITVTNDGRPQIFTVRTGTVTDNNYHQLTFNDNPTGKFAEAQQKFEVVDLRDYLTGAEQRDIQSQSRSNAYSTEIEQAMDDANTANIRSIRLPSGHISVDQEIDTYKSSYGTCVSIIGAPNKRTVLWPTSAVTRMFKIGGNAVNQSGAGMIKDLIVILYDAGTNPIAFGSDYGVSSWWFERVGILDNEALGSQTAVGIKLVKDNNVTDTQFYNTFLDVNFTSLKDGIDLSSGFGASGPRSNNNNFYHCRFFNVTNSVKILGDVNNFYGGNMSNDGTGSGTRGLLYDLRGNNNKIIGDYWDSVNTLSGTPWIRMTRKNELIGVIGTEAEVGAVKYWDDEVGTEGNAENFDDQASMVSTSLGQHSPADFPHKSNISLNGDFALWHNGTSTFTNPTSATEVCVGFRGARNGANFTIDRTTSGTETWKHGAALKIVSTVKPTSSLCGVQQVLYSSTASDMMINRSWDDYDFNNKTFTAFALVKTDSASPVARLTFSDQSSTLTCTTTWQVIRVFKQFTSSENPTSVSCSIGIDETSADASTIFVGAFYILPGFHREYSIVSLMQDPSPTLDQLQRTKNDDNTGSGWTTLGAIDSKIPYYGPDGTLLGYIPLYNSIT